MKEKSYAVKSFANVLPIYMNKYASIFAVPVVEHGVYPVFYSDFPLFLPILLSPPEAFLAFNQSKRPSQRLTMCALPSFFLTPIRRPGIPVVHRLL
jgi:hypothetical protein